MATQNPIIHSFKEVERFKEVIHYKLINVYNGKPQLSEILSLSEISKLFVEVSKL